MNVKGSGRGLLLVLGVGIVIALVVATFLYGEQKRREVEDGGTVTELTEEQQAEQPEQQDQPAQDQQQNQQEQTQPQDQTQQPPTQQDQQAQGSNPSQQPTIATGPQAEGVQSVPNTGPEDWAPFVTAGLVFITMHYLRGRKTLKQAELSS